jgi:hypothetical protein
MNFLETFFFNYFLKKVFQTIDLSSFSDLLIEVFLKIIFKIIATFIVSTNVSLILLNLLRSLISFLSLIFLKCCKTIINIVIEITLNLFNQIFEFKNTFAEFKNQCENIKDYKNHRSKKNFYGEQLIILEEWFELNQRYPYANKRTKQELANRTNLSIEQVSSWLANKRVSMRKNTFQSKKFFSPNNRLILSNFYEEKQYPNLQEIHQLEELTGLTQKQIKTWFIKKKFKSKTT